MGGLFLCKKSALNFAEGKMVVFAAYLIIERKSIAGVSIQTAVSLEIGAKRLPFTEGHLRQRHKNTDIIYEDVGYEDIVF